MQSNEQSIEQRFADVVLDSRRALRMSQKALAEALTERGLPVDASAISRIEKGNRAIRLSEATTIADLLGFSLADIEHPREPGDDFARLRKGVDGTLAGLFSSALDLAESLEAMVWFLEKHPEVLDQLEKTSGPKPTSIPEYLDWVRRRWALNRSGESLRVRLDDVEANDAARELIRTVSTAAMGDGHGEHPETR